jgi:hypothetical protein
MAPSRYSVRWPGIDCQRATRVAHRSVTTMGYTVTSLVPARPDRPGEVAVTRAMPDGGSETARVVITCDRQGAVLQPVEEGLFPRYEFSRAFGYSFRSLVLAPDEETPRAEQGLEVLVEALSPDEAVLALDAVPVAGAAVLVRVTVRNHTERRVAVTPASIQLVPADGGPAATPLEGRALEAALLPGAAGDRVRAGLLTATRVGARATVRRFLVYPPGTYREARVSIDDVETGETEGFVTPVQ